MAPIFYNFEQFAPTDLNLIPSLILDVRTLPNF